MTQTAISVTGLTRRYRDHLALDQVSLDVEAGSIIGLLGRNGASKTTLLRILAGQEFPSAGSVLVHGAPPAENEAVLRRLVFVREDQVYPDFKVRHALRVASWFYPNWSPELADALLADFELPPGRAIKKLSRGMRSALGIVIDHGRVVLTAGADDLRGVATAVSGPVLAVDEFTAGRVVWDRRRVASRASAVVVGALDEADRARARSLRLDLSPLTLQQLVVHAAAQPAAALERTSA
jgi:ABC-2 type transport system ATP-binding protein